MNALGERLRRLRNKKKLSQKNFGKLFGLSESAIGMYERNERKPDYETLEKFANFFEVSIDHLLGRTDDPGASSSKKEEPEVNVAWLGGRKEQLTDDEAEALELALEIHRRNREKRLREKKDKS